EVQGWRVFDYLDTGVWRSTETCFHLNRTTRLGDVVVKAVMWRRGVSAETLTMVAINSADSERHVRATSDDVVVEQVIAPRDAGVLWFTLRHGHAVSIEVSGRRWLRRADRGVFRWPRPTTGHPHRGWCQGPS